MDNMVSFYIGATLPLALLVFAGSYFSIWKRTERKLPPNEVIALFIALWVISAGLSLAFHVLLAGQDDVTRNTVSNLCGPLIVGVIIGRKLVAWRQRVLTGKQVGNK